jgi:hypothetical protein
MSIETLIAEAVATQINARFDALERKIDATNAVLVDVNQQIRDARASLEQALAECPCDNTEAPAPAPTPVPVPTPSPEPAPAPVDPPGSVRWRGILVTLDAQGRILFDGAMVPENSLTLDVTRAYVGADGLLWHDNNRGETYKFSGNVNGHWTRIRDVPTVTITASGSIAAP